MCHNFVAESWATDFFNTTRTKGPFVQFAVSVTSGSHGISHENSQL